MNKLTSENIHAQLLLLFNNEQYRDLLNLVDSHNLSLDSDPLAAQVAAAGHFQLGNFSTAANILQPHQAALATDSSYLSLYGATCRRLGQFMKSKELLLNALKLEPKSSAIRNNYANVLIDLDELESAKSILEALLSENPSNGDASTNLERLRSRESVLHITSGLDKGQELSNWFPSDPLMLAFADEEVRLAGGVALKNSYSKSGVLLADNLPSVPTSTIDSDRIELATRSIHENNPEFALQLLSQASLGYGAKAVVYMNAADAYVKLESFNEAEICYLHTLQLGGPSIPAFMNLSTLASIRGDLTLSRYYLDCVSKLDSDNPDLESAYKRLDAATRSQVSDYRFNEKWVPPSLNRQPSS